ncbi:MAG: GNAT family N-acetyltransferase, partial [Xanthomonadales bacterium]|nr:GNAT family N-acetyltransferase [Xanthomonadales bacterium]
MPHILIRQAEPADAALILRFITDLAVYEKAEDEVVATVLDIQRSLFSEGANAHA